MDKRPTYNFQGILIDSTTIKQAIQLAPLQRRPDVIATAFHFIQLLQNYEQTPTNVAINQDIKNILENRFLLGNQKINQNINWIVSPQEVYLLNKAGSLGRTLQRNCCIEDKAILEWQTKKEQGKKKQIIEIKQKIQTFGEKSNNELGWISKSKQYPYRVILVDSEKKNKAIYFKTQPQAYKVYFHYLNNLKIQINVPNLFQQLSSNKKNNIIQKFTTKLISNHRIIRKIISQNTIIQQKNQQTDNKEKGNQIKNILQKGILRQSFIKVQQKSQGYDNNFLNQILDRQDKFGRPNEMKQKSYLIMKLQDSYKVQLFQRWKNKNSGLKRNIQKKKFTKEPETYVEEHVPQVNVNFRGIQFLQISNPYFKPIVGIQLTKNDKILYEAVFNTFLRNKVPHLSYKVAVSKGSPVFTNRTLPVEDRKFRQYTLKLRVVDYLTNEEIIRQSIVLKNKLFSPQTYIFNEARSVKLQFVYTSISDILNSIIGMVKNPKQSYENQRNSYLHNQRQSYSEKKLENTNSPLGLFLQVQPLSNEVREKIRIYWQQQSTKKGIYSINSKIKITQILSIQEDKPLSWWLGLDEELYCILSMLKVASQIIGFRLIRSVIPIIQAIKILYSEIDDLLQAILAIIVNYTFRYFFPTYLNKIAKFHRILGLDTNCELDSKISLQMNTLDRIFELECPVLHQKFKDKNMAYIYIVYEYIYELFSKNLPLRVLISIWNFCFKKSDLIEMNFLLIAVWLLQFYEKRLLHCHRLRQIRIVLQSKDIPQQNNIIPYISELANKYFLKGKQEEKKNSNLLKKQPLDNVLYNFYRKQTEKLDQRKQNRQIQKRILFLKYQRPLELPIYPAKRYCLHIYFYKAPPIPGSLYIKSNSIQYQCSSLEKQRYFIISHLNSEAILEFIDNKSNQYSCKLETIQGINNFKVQLICDSYQKNSKGSKIIQIEYLCGLLNDSQIQILKKNKKFQQFIGSYMPIDNFKDQLTRSVQQCHFISEVDKNSGDEVGKKLKIIFSNNIKEFSELQFYIYWITTSSVTLNEKISYIMTLARNICNQKLLSFNKIVQKILLRMFMKHCNFPIDDHAFESCYNDCLQYEFDAPKIIKCRFEQNGKQQLKLQQMVARYASERAFKYFYGDLVVDEILQVCKEKIQEKLSSTSGTLTILYSSLGKLNLKKYKIIRRKNKQLGIQYENDHFDELIQDIHSQQPKILLTEVIPISKGTQTSRSSNLANSRQNQNLKIAQNINILKNCQIKLNQLLPLRYHSFPHQFNIPFFTYYYDLIYIPATPNFPSIQINDKKQSLKNICISKMPMKFNQHKKGETFKLENSLGLYGNLRKIPNNPKEIYFWIYDQNQAKQQKVKCLVFINHGFGVFRWQNCEVKGYRYKINERVQGQKQFSEKIAKKQYLISFKNNQFYARSQQVKINPEQEVRLREIQTNRSQTRFM